MITLKIPEGEYCEDCIFCDKDFFENSARCILFAERLRVNNQYGAIQEIFKLDQCPKEDIND